MQIQIPKRDKLLAEIPLFCKVKPKARPRYSGKTKAMYQPKNNQVGLKSELSLYSGMRINQPVIVDIHIGFESKGHPTSKMYGDIDNLVKSIYDCLVSENIIIDDLLIVGGESYKCQATEDQATIWIWGLSQETTKLNAETLLNKTFKNPFTN